MGFRESGPFKILVVDDEPILVTTTSAILREEGYEVAAALSGEEAVERAKSFSPDLLLSDIWMETMSGIEAAIRISTRLPSLKILFVSGDATLLDVLNVFPKRIVYSLMLKPVRVPDLLSVIAYMLPSVDTVKARTASEMTVVSPEHHDQTTFQKPNLAEREQHFQKHEKKFPVRSADPREYESDDRRRVSGFPIP
jgi:CheY-like chemotaxis protein